MTPGEGAPLDLAAFAPALEAALDGIVVADAAGRYLYVNPAAAQMLGMSRAALAGRDLLANFPAREHPHLRERFARSLAGQPGQWTTTIRRPDGEEREVSYTTMRLAVGGQPCVGVIFHDMAVEQLRLARERGALIQIAASVAAAPTLDSALDTLAANAVRATGAVAAAIVLLEGTPPRLRMAGTAGMPPGYAPGFNAAVAAGAPAPAIEALRERRPVILREARQFIFDQPATAPLRAFARDAPWDTVISVPLIYRHHDLGALNSYYPRDAAPGESEIAFLAALADQAAVAVENARLVVEAHEKAALEERQRLARELHDSVSQALFGIALGARTARALVDRDPPSAVEPLDYVLALAEAGLAEMRALIFELRPQSLQTEGLVVALSKQAAALRARHHLEVETDLGAEPDVSLDVKEALYRIGQEAMHNIVKHAQARRVTVSLATEADAITLDVTDDGIGFDPGGSFPGHLGLRSMRERATRLGGTLTVSSAAGQGTALHAAIPAHAARKT